VKKILGGLVVVALGIGVGGAGAYGVGTMVHHAEAPPVTKTEFVPTGTIMAPLVFPDGRLSGYASFEVQLEVAQGEGEEITKRLPLLLNAINMQTYRTPLASGPDGLIPGLEPFRKVVIAAAAETFGQKVVRRAVVTQAQPM